MNTNYYPVFLQLNNKLCVIVGGGDVAVRKAATLLECGAAVRVVSPVFAPELEALTVSGQIEAIRTPFDATALKNAYLVIAATSDVGVNHYVADCCRERGIPVNVVDAPELCDFIVPATIRRGPLTIAVSTGGNAPAMARQIRERLEEEFDEAYGDVLLALGEARTRILNEIPDPARRKRLFTALARADLVSARRSGGADALHKEIESIIQAIQ